MRVGDLLGSGTISGPAPDQTGALQVVGSGPGGRTLLWVIGLGLLCLGLWQATEVLVWVATMLHYLGRDNRGIEVEWFFLAVGMMLGAPILALATLRWPKRRALLVFSGIFAATHLLATVTDSFAVLLATRFVGAFVYAGFWSAAATTAPSRVAASVCS